MKPCLVFCSESSLDARCIIALWTGREYNDRVGRTLWALVRSLFGPDKYVSTAQSSRAFSDDYESEAPASLPFAESKTLSRLWKSQLFRSGHPSPVCDGSSGRQTHAGGEATFEVAQEEDDQRRGRKTLAVNVSEVSGFMHGDQQKHDCEIHEQYLQEVHSTPRIASRLIEHCVLYIV